MIYVGIDPGLSGAIARLDEAGSPYDLSDMPTVWVRSGARRRRTYAVPEVVAILLHPIHAPSEVRYVAELLHARPPQGLQAAWSLGYGIGLIRGILASRGHGLELVTPQRWHKVMLDGRAKGKGAKRARAAELWPGVNLGKRGSEDRAEALLLAEYGRRLGGQSMQSGAVQGQTATRPCP